VPVLAAYDVTSVASSSSLRCIETVRPYVDVAGIELHEYDGLAEQGASAKGVLEIVDDLLHHDEGVVLCSHRPVLPAVFDSLGVADVKLDPGAMLVVHHRKGKVVATERHSC
jgi:phosphohistidine phosphatase SixA